MKARSDHYILITTNEKKSKNGHEIIILILGALSFFGSCLIDCLFVFHLFHLPSFPDHLPGLDIKREKFKGLDHTSNFL